MSQFNINYLHSQSNRILSRQILIVGLAGLIAASIYLMKLNARIDTVQAQTRLVSDSKTASNHNKGGGNKFYLDAVHSIQTPWMDLLRSLEMASDDEVKMLSLEPDGQNRIVKISLIASDQKSMWAYVQNVRNQPLFHSVQLTANETAEINGRQVLKFKLEAQW